MLREERGFSLRKFALTIGADKSYLVDIEYGRKSPTLDTIWRIASGLDVTMSYLLYEVDSPRVLMEFDTGTNKDGGDAETDPEGTGGGDDDAGDDGNAGGGA